MWQQVKGYLAATAFVSFVILLYVGAFFANTFRWGCS